MTVAELLREDAAKPAFQRRWERRNAQQRQLQAARQQAGAVRASNRAKQAAADAKTRAAAAKLGT